MLTKAAFIDQNHSKNIFFSEIFFELKIAVLCFNVF